MAARPVVLVMILTGAAALILLYATRGTPIAAHPTASYELPDELPELPLGNELPNGNKESSSDRAHPEAMSPLELIHHLVVIEKGRAACNEAFDAFLLLFARAPFFPAWSCNFNNGENIVPLPVGHVRCNVTFGPLPLGIFEREANRTQALRAMYSKLFDKHSLMMMMKIKYLSNSTCTKIDESGTNCTILLKPVLDSRDLGVQYSRIETLLEKTKTAQQEIVAAFEYPFAATYDGYHRDLKCVFNDGEKHLDMLLGEIKCYWEFRPASSGTFGGEIDHTLATIEMFSRLIVTYGEMLDRIKYTSKNWCRKTLDWTGIECTFHLKPISADDIPESTQSKKMAAISDKISERFFTSDLSSGTSMRCSRFDFPNGIDHLRMPEDDIQCLVSYTPKKADKFGRLIDPVFATVNAMSKMIAGQAKALDAIRYTSQRSCKTQSLAEGGGVNCTFYLTPKRD